MLKEKIDFLLGAMCLAVFVILAFYLLLQDPSLVGPL